MRAALILLCLAAPALAQQPDAKYLLAPLQIERDEAANARAYCMADVAKLAEELADFKKKLAEAEAKVKN
jgi:hypothetical protein